ncbi:hypothetical protein T492DRAFT_318547 [Pavlovales sp. CCMP2436]|nr:hypothetical protein T492DRAFT_318547 [Pavlovales sp. CCMP2436]
MAFFLSFKLSKPLPTVRPTTSCKMKRARVATSSRPFWWGGIACFAAAITFFLSCLLNLAYLSGTAFETKNPFMTGGTGTYEKWTSLDVDFLRMLWEYRVASANLNIAVSALTTIAFFFLLAAMMALADAFEVSPLEPGFGKDAQGRFRGDARGKLRGGRRGHA